MLLSLIVATIFNLVVLGKISREEKFSGMGWGLLNGIFGIGIIWFIIACASIYNKIGKIKHKKYAEYASFQMKDCLVAYGVCFVIWVIIILAINMA